jgi:hypothetical protein
MKVRFVWANGDHELREMGEHKLELTHVLVKFQGNALSLEKVEVLPQARPKQTRFELMRDEDGQPCYREVVNAVGRLL